MSDVRLPAVKATDRVQVRITRFDAQDEGATFLAYFLLSPGQEPELTPIS